MKTAKTEKLAIILCLLSVAVAVTILALRSPEREAEASISISSVSANYCRTAAPAEDSISINTASAEELCGLPGIGEELAGRIIEFREKNGVFRSIGDILDVKGIGFATFEKIRDMISI